MFEPTGGSAPKYAGKMGIGTREVGDLIAKLVS